LEVFSRSADLLVGVTERTTASTIASLAAGWSFTLGTASGSSLSLSGLLQGSWDDILAKVEVVSEVFDTLVGQEVVIPLPAELFSDISSRSEGLAKLDDGQVGDFDEGMLGGMEILLGAEDALYRKGNGS
jgi:hypothetical protein